ncbi:hypothetical protein MFRU_053g00070 [Monilinia fructicola]|nr:hypothetical protein MFRU_053g00070 [Monilinia fructicola]
MRPSALLPLLLSTAQACIHATIHWDINGYQFALTDNDTTRCTSTAGTTDAPLTNPGTKGATFAIPSGDCQAGYSAKIWIRLGENYAAKLEQYTDIEGVVRGPYDMGLGSSSTMYYGTSLQYAEWNRTWC